LPILYNDMYILELKNIEKKFILKDVDNPYFGSEIYALKDINIKVQPGQIIGLIGRNGSGKTTLLNIIAGITSPTSGEIKINGKVSCLISLGVGFQNELSGRENIYLNASLLGMSKSEIKNKFNEIVKFSELKSFLDLPLHSYSQGMKMRLAFSVAINVDFDILLIDEIISVGDISFQKKCFEKIESFKKEGKTMIVASQSMELIERLCDRVILLEKGELIKYSEPKEAIENYLAILAEKKFFELYPHISTIDKIKWWAKKEEWGTRLGSGGAQITNVEILNAQDKNTDTFNPGEAMKVKVDFIVKRRIREPHFGVAIFREDGVYCYGPNTSFDGYRFEEIKEGKGYFTITYKKLNLMPGDYRISVGIWDKLENYPFDYLPGFYKFQIIGNNDSNALLNLEYKWDSKNLDFLNEPLDLNKEIKKIVYNLNEYWGKQFGDNKIIRRIDLVDKKGLLRDSFSYNETLIVDVELEDKVYLEKPFFIWVGIFRDDGVYCHGAFRKLAEKEREIRIIYPHIKLLTGRYYISSVIFNEGMLILDCCHGIYHFEIYTHRKDHGTVYIEHKWKWGFDGKI